MKIYFDGCSWTEGAELENPEEERYSKLICNELGAEEYNIAMSGGSNDRIVRNLLVENNIEDYDMAVIQMTFPVRTEFYNNKWKRDRWIRINPRYNYNKWLHGEDGNIKKLGEKFECDSDFWKYYYLQITNEKYFETKEKIHYHTIRNSCKMPLVLITINRWTKLPFDLQLNDGTRYEKHRFGHPNKHLHKEYADKILKML